MQNNIKDYINWLYLDCWREPESIIPSMTEFENIAKNSPEAFDYIVNMFNEEQKNERKIMLADVLIRVNPEPVKEFLYAIILGTDQSIIPTIENQAPEDYKFDNIMWATLRLIQLNDKRAVDFLLRIMPSLNESDLFPASSNEAQQVYGEKLLALFEHLEGLFTWRKTLAVKPNGNIFFGSKLLWPEAYGPNELLAASLEIISKPENLLIKRGAFWVFEAITSSKIKARVIVDATTDKIVDAYPTWNNEQS
jgi:hypothetical protein